ncbi:tetratricopeptide repeat protein [Pseudoalteromonas piscicida]|uniref:tetratricopeptide repeat protein n=1 Tax=Pseudoalteromonas piscicida TaxID=43662 RepID=UPI001C94243D|nr:tetratricopeptide repeat protein [Pseudoalteromonas piscicida]QZO13937.1 soluble NSF attachment family protein [Pseudoalteromonas piscicida]
MPLLALLLALLLVVLPAHGSECPSANNANLTSQILSCKQHLETLEPNGAQAFDAHLELVSLYRRAGDIKLSNQILDELMAWKLTTLQRFQVLRQSGINRYRQRNYIQALESFHEAQTLAAKLQQNELLGKSANDLANAYQALGDLDTALTLFLESYQIAKATNNQQRQAITLNNLGNVSRDINQLDDAILSFRQAHALHQQAGDQVKANHTLLSIAEVFYKKRDYNKATEIIEDLLQPLTQSGAYTQLSRAYLLLAEIAIAQNHIAQAQQQLASFKRTRQLIQHGKVDQRALLIEAKLKQLEGDNLAAQTILKQGLEAHNQQNSQLTELFYIALLQSQLQTHAYKEAVETAQRYNDMLKTSRVQSENLYQFRLQSANVLTAPKRQTETSMLSHVLVGFITFLAGVLVTYCFIRNTARADTHGVHSKHTSIDEQAARQLMVEVMTLTLTLWEQSSGKTRVELAEESKVWKVNIDDGRLRVRTLERYLNIKTLPKKPRIRNIVTTAQYVLTQCQDANFDTAPLCEKVAQLEQILACSNAN